MNDLEFMDILIITLTIQFNIVPGQAFKFVIYQMQYIQRIKEYLYQIILEYENTKIQLFTFLFFYTKLFGEYSQNVEQYLHNSKMQSTRNECINYIEKKLFN
ncbi:unnamed protein product [Paramecium sonneborni]|uniref:Uncharacterized protein n=1 Tax=Paramecium sonneborni TaxID=65129 RepID=A0A8S1RKY0_9CILI|nr:unnamed protein product [Paramecium sonneborni]